MAKHLAKGFRNVILAGLPGSGKSTFGKTYAHFSGRTFLDFDAFLEHLAGRTIPEIFASEGEEGFRALERKALAKMERRTQSVIALGGGTLCAEENFAFLRGLGLLVHLFAPTGDLARRIHAERGTRPMFIDCDDEERVRAKLETLREIRAPYHERCDVTLDTGFGGVDTLKIQLGLLERRILLQQRRLRGRETLGGPAGGEAPVGGPSPGPDRAEFDRDDGVSPPSSEERIPDSAFRSKDDGARAGQGEGRAEPIERTTFDPRSKGNVRVIQKETRAGVLGVITGRPSLAKEMEARLPSGGRPRRSPKKGEGREGREGREGAEAGTGGFLRPRPPRDPNAPRGERPPRDPNAPRDPNVPRGERPPRDPNVPRGERPPRDPNMPREHRPPRDPTGPRGDRPPRDPNAPRGDRPPRDPNAPRGNRPPRQNGARDPNTARGNRPPREPNMPRENRPPHEFGPRDPNAAREIRSPREPSVPQGDRVQREPMDLRGERPDGEGAQRRVQREVVVPERTQKGQGGSGEG